MLRSTMTVSSWHSLPIPFSSQFDCTNSAKALVDDHRKLDRFDRIQLNFDARISIHKGDVPGLVIHAQENR